MQWEKLLNDNGNVKINLDTLKRLITKKLKLSLNEVVSDIIYRVLVSLSLLAYDKLYWKDNSDGQFILDTDSKYFAQLRLIVLYMAIATNKIDLNLNNYESHAFTYEVNAMKIQLTMLYGTEGVLPSY